MRDAYACVSTDTNYYNWNLFNWYKKVETSNLLKKN